MISHLRTGVMNQERQIWHLFMNGYRKTIHTLQDSRHSFTVGMMTLFVPHSALSTGWTTPLVTRLEMIGINGLMTVSWKANRLEDLQLITTMVIILGLYMVQGIWFLPHNLRDLSS